MLHEPKEKRQVSFVDPLFIEREDEITSIGVQNIIGILNPFGNSFQGQHVAKIIVAKKAGKIRLVDFGINSHGASARLNRRAVGPRRGLVLATPMQEVKRERAIVSSSSVLSAWKPCGLYAERRSGFLPISAITALASGWMTPHDTISLAASSGLICRSITSRAGKKK